MDHPTSLLSLLLLIYLSTGATAQIPPIPKLNDLAQSFETNVEVVDLSDEKSATAVVREFYDFDQKTGRLDFLAVGKEASIFVNGNTQEIFTVDDTSCTKSDGGTYELDLFYGWSNQNPLYVGPSAFILMVENDSKMQPSYVGEAEVRNIKCNHYRYESKTAEIVTIIDYYFSAPTWRMPTEDTSESEKMYPVRIVAQRDSKTDYLNQTMDYLYFRPNFNNKQKFQTPVGLGCVYRDTVEEENFPKIPNAYGFSAENFDLLHNMKHSDTAVNFYRIWYDQRAKVARMDAYTEKGVVSDLHDFRTGVMYHMHDFKTCTFRKPMRKSVFLGYDSDSLVGRMKEPKEVLQLQGDFYLIGQENVRGLPCQVYENVEINTTLADKDYRRLVTTVYFASTTTKTVVDGTKETVSPVDILITGYGDGDTLLLKQQFQIFAFTETPGREFYDGYPVEVCFPASNQKSYFTIRIGASEDDAKKIESVHSEFKIIAKSKILHIANITEIRLAFIMIDYTVSGIYISGLMLDRPPFLAQFLEWRNFETNETTSFRVDFDADNPEDCAAACISLKSNDCKGFHMCGGDCFLNTGEITDEYVSPIPIGRTCDVYIRGVRDSQNNQQSLEVALNNLVEATKKKKLEFDVPITMKDEVDVLVATDIVINMNKRGSDDVSDYPYTLVKAGVQHPLKSTTLKMDEEDSEEGCYRQCKDSTVISCASFSYCAQGSNKMCRISSVLLGDNNIANETTKNDKCDVFSLLYLDFYDQYPGRSLSVKGEKTVQDVQSTEECARNCREATEMYCRGFEYCKANKSCELHSKHVLDVKVTETEESKPECVHYASKFIADYRDKGDTIINDKSNVRNEITLEECARACSEEVPGCKSISYCPATSVGAADSSCSLTPMTLNYGGVPTMKKENCRLYTKREHVNDWSIPSPPEKSGYTKSSFTGLIIGMIILGLVVGALLFVAYSYYRSKHSADGMTVRFSKQENI